MDRLIANVISAFVPASKKRKIREYFGVKKVSPLRLFANVMLPRFLTAEFHNAVVFELSGGLTDQIRTICFARFLYDNWQGDKPDIILNVTKLVGFQNKFVMPRRFDDFELQSLLNSTKRSYDATGKRLMSDAFELGKYNIDWSWVAGFVTMSVKKVTTYELFGRHYRIYRSNLFLEKAKKGKIKTPVYMRSFPDFDIFELPLADKFLKTMTVELTGANAAKLAEIKQTPNSICVHIRRGDYIAHNNGLTLQGEYFEKAIEKIIKQTGCKDATLFVFSDDWHWAKQEIDFNFPNVNLKTDFVRLNDISEPTPELELMRTCKHFVISVGNFARIAAEMSENEDKIVIEPSKCDFVRDSLLNTKKLITKTLEHSVAVIIPMYQSKLSERESLSLAQAFKILSRYPIVIIKPVSLDLSKIEEQYPQVVFESFDDEYFKGLYGYNRLMLSSEFYERFLKYDYILIYQLDAWVFRDELEYWCNKGYDYIGAPWIVKPKYKLLPLRLFIWLKAMYYKIIGLKYRHVLLKYKVGNGGFSLRRVNSCYLSTQKHPETIAFYLEKYRLMRKTVFNEDVFWAIENPDFRYPPFAEALQFSFDRDMLICLKMNNYTLPFGCHACDLGEIPKSLQL